MPSKIYFEKNHWSQYLYIAIALVLIVIGLAQEGSWQCYGIHVLGLVILCIGLSKYFWFKNYVRYSNTKMYLKIKKLIGYTLRFNQIESIKLYPHFFVITKKNGNKLHISSRHLHYSDVKKIDEIIKLNLDR